MSLHQLFSAHNYFQGGHLADSFIAFGISFVHRNHGIISKTQFLRCIENLEFSTSYFRWAKWASGAKKKMLKLHPKSFTSYFKLDTAQCGSLCTWQNYLYIASTYVMACFLTIKVILFLTWCLFLHQPTSQTSWWLFLNCDPIFNINLLFLFVW